MKNLILLSVLIILLPAVISSQSHKDRIIDPFRTISKEATHAQMFGEEQARGIEFPGIIHKNKKANKPSSVSYQPTKITIKDMLMYTYTYNSSGECLTELREIWTNNDWVNIDRYTDTYDNSGKLLTEFGESWTNNAWVNYSRYTYTYDNSGNLVTSFGETWTNNAWVNSFRYTGIYNNFGNMLTGLSESWTNNAWVNSDRSTYTYDNAGNLLTNLYERWTNNAWVIFPKDTYTYDNSGNLITRLVENWTNNAWVNSDRSTYTYDNAGNLLTDLGETWTNNAWVNYSRNTYTYDNSGNLVTNLRESWSNNAWVNSNIYTYTFDNNGNCIHGEIYTWHNDSWVPFPLYSQITYNHKKDSWSGQFSVVDVEYAFLEGVANESTGVQSFNLQQNYPNPFNPSTTINYSLSKEGNVKLTVFNSLGSKVATIVNEYKTAGNYSVQFNGNNLASGIYFYSIRAISTDGKNDFSSVRKMILLK